jgi:hypothetical protein
MGPGVIDYTIAPNASGMGRAGAIRVAGQTFAIKQKG